MAQRRSAESSGSGVPPPRDQALEQLSSDLVAFYREAFGRGPRHVRTYCLDPCTVVVLLEDTLTVAERNLAAMGEHGQLRDTRLYLQYAVEPEMRAIAERALGRRPIAFVSGIDTVRDVAMEVFTFAPATQTASPAPPRHRS